jgi:hypothetical protein
MSAFRMDFDNPSADKPTSPGEVKKRRMAAAKVARDERLARIRKARREQL